MAEDRDRWLAYADTVKQVALAEDRSARPRPEAPKKVPLAAVRLDTQRAEPDDDEPPDSTIREIPTELSPHDPRADASTVPPLEIDVDLD